jgi:hypothetical protein
MKHPPRNIVIDWLNTVWSTDLPANSKLVACNLRRYMNSQNDMAWPSIARIAGECGLSDQCIRKHLKLLCSEGWLTQSGKSNLDTFKYQASTPATIAAPATIAPLQSFTPPPATIAAELNNITKQVDSNKGFAIPGLSELLEYAKEKQYTNFDHESFFDFYQSKGWYVGKNKMKDWKAAVRNWNKRNKNANSTRHAGQHNNKGKLSGGDRTRAARQAARDRLAP